MRKTVSILVVDDNTDNLSLLSRLLKNEGYEISPANSGELALASLENNIPDLVLLDIQMPGIDGFEVCKRMKKKEKLAEIPIIFLTVATKMNDKLEGFRLGAVDYISKPFQKEELLARIKTHLSLYRYNVLFRERSAEKLIESEKRLSLALKVGGAGLYYHNEPIGNELYHSDRWAEILGYKKEELPPHDKFMKWLTSQIHPDDISVLGSVYRDFISGRTEKYDLEIRMRKKSGEWIYVKGLSNAIERDDAGKVKGIIGLMTDITERKNADKILRESERQLKNAERVAHLGSWEMEIATGKSTWSDEFFRICGYEPYSIEPSSKLGFTIIHPDDRDKAARAVDESIKTGKHYDIEKRITRPDGTIRWVHSIGEVIFGEQGKANKISGSFLDITERKRIEDELKGTLKEKEILIQEIHHRVKNNMQVISSLLNLQASSIDDDRVKGALKESQSRILTMSAVHEVLYGSKNLSEINMKSYLSKITGDLVQTYAANPDEVKLNTEIEELSIGIKQASPIGLIINELISNSLKYAFPDDQKGEISVSMNRLDKQLELTVMDNGVGMPDGLDWKNSNTLGLKLVRTLVENQLDGSIDVESKNGTKFTIKFNIEA
jgi:PAS domain S-box-containing protein